MADFAAQDRRTVFFHIGLTGSAMFGKNEVTRITDTLTMIGAAPVLTPAIRAQVVALVNAQYHRLTPADQLAYSAISGDMSIKAGIPVKADRGTDAQREKRRAIYLLWMAIGKRHGIDLIIRPRALAARNMPVAGLDTEFDSVMQKAATVSSLAGAAYVFGQLEAHPVRFITQHKLIVLGVPTGGDRFSNAPNGNEQNVLQFHFQYDSGNDRFTLGGHLDALLGSAHSFNTVSVPAVHWTQVPAVGPAPGMFTGILGCELAGANFMLTTQFTGCAFNWTNHGGMLRASHVSPSGGGVGNYPGGGAALALRMTALGVGAHANAAGTATTVFGAGSGNAPVAAGNPFYPNVVLTPIRWVTIFGVLKGGVAWRFYTQVVNGAEQIVESRRIY